MVRDGLLLKYRDAIATGKYARQPAGQAGAGRHRRDGHVMPDVFGEPDRRAWRITLILVIKNPPGVATTSCAPRAAKNPKAFTTGLKVACPVYARRRLDSTPGGGNA